MSTENNCDNSFGLKGVVDVLLIDKATHKIEKCFRKTNHITEPFARWLMLGQLAMYNSTGTYGTYGVSTTTDRFCWIQQNPINQLLGASPVETYQVIQGSCGTRPYAIYVLGEPVTIDYTTQIPPYFNASLNAMSDKKKSDFRELGLDEDGEQEVDSPLVVYYGTSSTSNDGSYTMAIDNANSRWGMPLRNPAFTATFVKNAGTAYIRSVVLGAMHGYLTAADGQPGMFIEQSSPIIQSGWDNVWQTATFTTASGRSVPTQVGADNIQAVYLFCPFGRLSMINGHWGDGLYTLNTSGTSGTVGSYMSYFDFATKQFENNTTNTGPRQNTITGDYYATDPATISTSIRQGIVLGTANETTKAIRVNSAGSTSTAIKVNIVSQASLQSNTTATTTIVLTPEGDCPEALYNNCHPVMVPIRGNETTDDVVEIFVSTAVGEFVDDENGIGGTGVAIHKLTLAIDAFRTSGNASDISAHITDNGRVAVTPWAIGQLNAPTVGATSDVAYVTGAYNEGLYYLPFTHLLRGCSPHNWTYIESSVNDRELVQCSTARYLPGMVCDSSTYTRLRDFLFYNGSYARTMATTDEGFVPLTLNTLHRWSITMGSVISGVSFDEPIKKKDSQILVIRYTYTFDIVPTAPSAPVFTASNATINTIDLAWENQPTVLSYKLQRTADVFTNLLSIVPLRPPVPSESVASSMTDTDLFPNTLYKYRLAARNNGGDSDWTLQELRTLALTSQVATPVFATPETSTVTTICPTWTWTDAISSLYFTAFEIEYQEHGATEWTALPASTALQSPTATQIVISGLSENTAYNVRIRATVPSSYYATEDETKALSNWATTAISTIPYPLPVTPADIALVAQVYDETALTSQIDCTWTAVTDMKYRVTTQSNTEATATEVAAANTSGTVALPTVGNDTINLVTITTWNDGTNNGVDSANAKTAIALYKSPQRFLAAEHGITTGSTLVNYYEYGDRYVEWSNIANAMDTSSTSAATAYYRYSYVSSDTSISMIDAFATVFGGTATNNYTTPVPLTYWNVKFDSGWGTVQYFASNIKMFCSLYGMSDANTEVLLDQFEVPFDATTHHASRDTTTPRVLASTVNYPAYRIRWQLRGATTNTGFEWPTDESMGYGATNTLQIYSIQLFNDNATISNAVQLSGVPAVGQRTCAFDYCLDGYADTVTMDLTGTTFTATAAALIQYASEHNYNYGSLAFSLYAIDNNFALGQTYPDSQISANRITWVDANYDNSTNPTGSNYNSTTGVLTATHSGLVPPLVGYIYYYLDGNFMIVGKFHITEAWTKAITGTAGATIDVGTLSLLDISFSDQLPYSIITQTKDGETVDLFSVDGTTLKMTCTAGTYLVDVQSDGFGTHKVFTIQASIE